MSSKHESKTVPDVRLGLWDEGKHMPRKMNFFHTNSTAIYGTMACCCCCCCCVASVVSDSV